MQLCFLQSQVPKSCILNTSTPGNLHAGVMTQLQQYLVTLFYYESVVLENWPVCGFKTVFSTCKEPADQLIAPPTLS